MNYCRNGFKVISLIQKIYLFPSLSVVCNKCNIKIELKPILTLFSTLYAGKAL